MEQGNCLDSTPVSAVQEMQGEFANEPALDAAVVSLLQAGSPRDQDLGEEHTPSERSVLNGVSRSSRAATVAAETAFGGTSPALARKLAMQVLRYVGDGPIADELDTDRDLQATALALLGHAADAHPDAALLAAADRARPFVAEGEKLEIEFRRVSEHTDRLALDRFGTRPDVREAYDEAMAYDVKVSALREETGWDAAWIARSNVDTAIWELLGPFADEPAKTLEGAAAKAVLADADLWDSTNLAREVTDLFYNLPVEALDHSVPFSALPPIPNFSRYSVNDLRRTYDAFKLATDVMGLTTWTTSKEGAGDALLDSEADRLAELCSHIVDELKRREPVDRFEAIARSDTLISHELACGSYDGAMTVAAEAHAKRQG